MNETLFNIFGVTVTGWKLVGYAGVLMFTSRWFVQLWHSKRAGRSVMPRIFWIMSIAGSLLCLTYFVFGKNDSVGIISYLFPSAVASYNLFLDIRNPNKTDPKS